MANKVDSSGGLDVGSVLTIVFIVLKLCGVIAWSWWWVLSPIWMSIGLFLAILLCVAAVWYVRN